MKNCSRYFALALALLTAACKPEPEIPMEPQANIETAAALPAVLTESSGLERTAAGTLWSINDGGPAELYAFNEQGALLRTLTLAGADNVDWEDLALDDAGQLYVGDFGNNDNDRTNLRIYIVAPPDAIAGAQTTPSVIAFTLSDQTAFPPPAPDRHFDVEAMAARAGQLYLFTRDRSEPFAGKTRLYRLTTAPNAQTAAFVAEFTTDTNRGRGAITSADFSPDGSRLALLANEALYVFSNFSGENFFAGDVTRYDLADNLQYEGVVFVDNTTLLLTNEGVNGAAGTLWRVRLPQ